MNKDRFLLVQMNQRLVILVEMSDWHLAVRLYKNRIRQGSLNKKFVISQRLDIRLWIPIKGGNQTMN